MITIIYVTIDFFNNTPIDYIYLAITIMIDGLIIDGVR